MILEQESTFSGILDNPQSSQTNNYSSSQGVLSMQDKEPKEDTLVNTPKQGTSPSVSATTGIYGDITPSSTLSDIAKAQVLTPQGKIRNATYGYNKYKSWCTTGAQWIMLKKFQMPMDKICGASPAQPIGFVGPGGVRLLNNPYFKSLFNDENGKPIAIKARYEGVPYNTPDGIKNGDIAIGLQGASDSNVMHMQIYVDGKWVSDTIQDRFDCSTKKPNQKYYILRYVGGVNESKKYIIENNFSSHTDWNSKFQGILDYTTTSTQPTSQFASFSNNTAQNTNNTTAQNTNNTTTPSSAQNNNTDNSSNNTTDTPKETTPTTFNNKKVQAVADCIKWSAAALGQQPHPELSPDVIVSNCEKHGFDLPLLMATAHYESHFGADPKASRARETNSIFSVGLYDNGENVVSYDTINDSIPAYINLMKKNYMANKKSLNDLLSPKEIDQNKTKQTGVTRYNIEKGIVNVNGAPYSTSPNYENMIARIRNTIIKRFPGLAS